MFKVTTITVALYACFLASAVHAQEPFGLAAVPMETGSIPEKWAGVKQRIRLDTEILDLCQTEPATCPAPAQRYLAVIAGASDKTGLAQIGNINRAVNLSIHPVSDMEQWGVPDRWSPPLETFSTGKGDCEDYAIAKYVALERLGISPSDLRLIVVYLPDRNEDHAVTAVRLNGTWLILNNLTMAIIPASAMINAVPLAELDDDGAKRFTAPAVATIK